MDMPLPLTMERQATTETSKVTGRTEERAKAYTEINGQALWTKLSGQQGRTTSRTTWRHRPAHLRARAGWPDPSRSKGSDDEEENATKATTRERKMKCTTSKK